MIANISQLLLVKGSFVEHFQIPKKVQIHTLYIFLYFPVFKFFIAFCCGLLKSFIIVLRLFLIESCIYLFMEKKIKK